MDLSYATIPVLDNSVSWNLFLEYIVHGNFEIKDFLGLTIEQLGKYYNAINSTLVRPNVTTVVPFVPIVFPFAGHVFPLNRTTVIPFTIDVPLQVLHIWRLGIEIGR